MNGELLLLQGRRLANELNHFLSDIQHMLQTYEQAPQPTLESSSRKWRDVAIPNLTDDRRRLESALSSIDTSRGQEELLRIASDTLGLAKHLDTFRLDLGGPQAEENLCKDVSAIVAAASNILSTLSSQIDAAPLCKVAS